MCSFFGVSQVDESVSHPNCTTAPFAGAFGDRRSYQMDPANAREVALESLTAIKRAGADTIITYFAKPAAQWLAR